MKGTSLSATRRSRAGSRRRRCSMAIAAGPPSSHTARTPGSMSADRLPAGHGVLRQAHQDLHVAAHDPAHPRQQRPGLPRPTPRRATGSAGCGVRARADRWCWTICCRRAVGARSPCSAMARIGTSSCALEAVHQAEQQRLLGRRSAGRWPPRRTPRGRRSASSSSGPGRTRWRVRWRGRGSARGGRRRPREAVCSRLESVCLLTYIGYREIGCRTCQSVFVAR